MFLSLFFQSYALYIAGDENATLTNVSKYLVKISAGLFVHVCPASNVTLHLFDCILGLNLFTVFVCVNIY